MKHLTGNETDLHYLQLLAQSFPTVADASTEIINLEAIMALPKGTEHFLADIHGESEAFRHILKNASGNIKRKVNELFGNDRMLEALNKDPDAEPKQALNNVRTAVDAFVGDAEQFDDLTMLCFRYKGPRSQDDE